MCINFLVPFSAVFLALRISNCAFSIFLEKKNSIRKSVVFRAWVVNEWLVDEWMKEKFDAKIKLQSKFFIFIWWDLSPKIDGYLSTFWWNFLGYDRSQSFESNVPSLPNCRQSAKTNFKFRTHKKPISIRNSEFQNLKSMVKQFNAEKCADKTIKIEIRSFIRRKRIFVY